MASQVKQQFTANQHMRNRQWPKVPTVGPTWRFEVEYLVQHETRKLRDQMRAAGIEHEALLNLERKLDAQRVAGYVQTEDLFYNCVAFHAEALALQHASELNASQQKVIDSFVRSLRKAHPLSKRAMSQRGEIPADWQEIVQRSVQAD